MSLPQEPHAPGEQVVGVVVESSAITQGTVPRISPFVGLLYDGRRVGPLARVTTPPYDTIGPGDLRRFLAADPHNVIRIDLGEDSATDDGPAEKYRRAGSLLRSWRTEGVLVQTPEPAYFPYEMRFAYRGAERTIRGLVCAVELEDWGGSILPHERTMPGPVADRLRLLRETRANLSAIEAVFAGPADPLSDVLDAATARRPVAELTDEEGVDHRLWIAPGDEDDAVARSLAASALMIADGHHRYTTALRYRDEMRRTHGPGPWDRAMMLIVDAATQDLPVLPLHRILRGGDVAPVGARVRDLEEVLSEVDDTKLRYGMALRGPDGALEHRVAELAGEPPTVRALHEQLLIDHDDELVFTPDPIEAELAVRTGAASAAFLLPATTALRIRDVVARGDRLPQKSTYFYPKPRTGLVMRPLDPTAAAATRPRPAPAS
jgi:uncharacterized protein (DUF1015 family)